MNNKNKHKLSTEGFSPLSLKWFTLVEMLVAITIFWIVMVSVMMIYSTSTQISIKADINREMQQNIKSTIETIADDVRRNWIVWVSTNPILPTDNYDLNKEWIRLETWKNRYILYWFKASIWENIWNAIAINNNIFCNDIKNSCFIMKCNKDWTSSKIGPLSNSKMSISDLRFYATDWKIPKVTINFVAKPSVKKWLASKLIDKSKIVFQTTISERILQVK